MSKNFSRLIQGCMTWGIWGRNLSVKEMARRISENIEIGVSTFDHADIYGDYTTEEMFGKALQISNISRENIQLISKCGIQLKNDKRGTSTKHYNYSSRYIINQVETSLKNLNTEYLDLFLLHRPSPLMQVNGITRAIEKLKNEGKIKSFGVSNFTPEQIKFISSELYISTNQIQCSLTHTKAFEDDSLFYHQKKKIKTMAWSPFGKIFSINENSELYILLNKLSEKYNCNASQLALAWLLKHPAKICPVIGTTKTSRVKEAVESLQINIELQDWFELYEASRGREVE